MLHRLTARERLTAAALLAASGTTVALALFGYLDVALASLSFTVLLVGLTTLDSRARSRRLGRQVHDGLQQWSVLLQDVQDEIRRPRMEVLETQQKIDVLDSTLQARLDQLSQQLQGTWSTKDKRWDRLTTRMSRERVELQRQLLAMAQLLGRVDASARLPGPGGWAAEASTLMHLSDLILQRRPDLVVECGSGASTVWLSYLLRGTGGRLVSLEHDHGFAEQTREQLRTHGLVDIAEVRDAPLTGLTVGGEKFTWYDVKAVEDLHGISLLFVDGPPQGVNKTVRYPALPLLGPRLAPAAVVVLDDGHRPGEKDIVQRWLRENPELLVTHDTVDRAVTLELGSHSENADLHIDPA